MSDENEETPMAECGSCRAIVPINTTECPECGISFSGVSDEALGECGACNSLVPLDSTKCPDCVWGDSRHYCLEKDGNDGMCRQNPRHALG